MFGDLLNLSVIVKNFLQFYGFDWIGLMCGNAGIFLITQTKRQKTGFLLGATANVAWFCFAFIVGSVPNMIASLSSMSMYSIGLYRQMRETSRVSLVETVRGFARSLVSS